MNLGNGHREGLRPVGLSASEVQERLNSLRAEDTDWRNGRSALHVYWAGDDVEEIALCAYASFVNSNPLAPSAFPSSQWFENEILGASLPLWNAPLGAGAILTSGGTESILLAMQAMRQWAREKSRAVDRPAIVVPLSAHPAYEKAATLLDLVVRRVRLNDNFQVDLDHMGSLIDDEVIGIVGSAPCLPFGTIDPIEQMGVIAQERDLWFHVDACLGGYLAPFLRKAGFPVPPFDFAIAGVRSLSADLHKYGYAPKGVSVLAYRDQDDRNRHLFRFSDWPKGGYETRTLYGTRSGGLIAAAWAVMNYLGEAGYVARAEAIMAARRRLELGLADLGRFKLFGTQPLGTISFACADQDLLNASVVLESMGWYPSRIANPSGLHMTITPVHATAIEDYLRDLRAAMATDSEDTRLTPGRVMTY